MNDSINLPDASRPATLASSLSTTTALSSPALSSDNAPPPTKRGRKSETPVQRLERLQRAVADAKIAAREAERRMFAVVGEALLAEAEADAQLRSADARHITPSGDGRAGPRRHRFAAGRVALTATPARIAMTLR